MGPDNVYGGLAKSSATVHVEYGKEGFFDARHAHEELGEIARHGLNNIRLHSMFLAWLMDPKAFQQTFRSILKACMDHGLRVTCSLWNTATAWDDTIARAYPHPWFWFPLLRRANIIPQARFQLPSPGLIKAHWDFVLALYLPFASRRPAGEPWAGTLYEEPGNLWFGADPANWPEIYPSFTTRYLQDIASAFEEYPEAFQSYDLFNEPDGIRDFNTSAPLRSHVQSFISYTHRTVDAVHVASGKMVLRRYTIGWAGIGTDPVKRQMTSSLIQSGVVHAYLSTHSYTDGSAFDAVVNVNSGFAASLGIPYVCSEFWWLDSRAPTRAIEPMLHVLLRHRSGGQMWGFLQSNVFYANRMPVDGVVRPLPGQWLPTQPWFVRKLAFDVPLPKHLRDVEQWARTAPRRTPVYPP